MAAVVLTIAYIVVLFVVALYFINRKSKTPKGE